MAYITNGRLAIMKHLRHITQILGYGLLCGLVISPHTIAMSTNQKKALQAGALYSNTEDAGNCSASPTTTVVPGAKLASGSNVYILGDSITAISESTYVSAFQAKGITANVDGSGDRGLLTNKGVKAGRLTT